MTKDLVVQMPDGQANKLVLLFHGVGSNAQSMAPIGREIAEAMPQAAVVSVPGRHPSDLGGGYQWFSVRGVTEENRPARVTDAIPDFNAVVKDWQDKTGVPAERTMLVGFSQGSIMALEASQQPGLLAGQVVSLAGRYAKAPRIATTGTIYHFIHGEVDQIIAAGFAADAAMQLAELGVQATVDIIPGLGHQVNEAMLARMLARVGT